MSNRSPKQRCNRVYVLEVYHPQNKRWYIITTHRERATAHMLMRAKRNDYPREKFRTTTYESTVPSHAE